MLYFTESFMENKQEEEQNVKISTIVSIVSLVFIVIVGTVIFLLAKGYRINLEDKEIKKTGVLAISTEPTTSTVTIDYKDRGTLQRGITLDVGTHTVKVSKEGYRDWNGTEVIVEGKSTIENVMLILEDNTLTNVWSSDLTVQEVVRNKNNTLALIILKDSDKSTYVYKYKFTTYIWDFSQNPTLLLTTEEDISDLDLSPNGNWAVVNISGIKNIWNISDNSYFPLEISDTSNLTSYTSTWANNSNYLILESDAGIYSYNPANKMLYTLLQKNTPTDKIIWTTDGNGYFYYVEKNNKAYDIVQLPLNATTPKKTTVNTLFVQNDTSIINKYRKSITENEYNYFDGSTDESLIAGNILDINVDNKAEGLSIKTDIATYFYDMEAKKHIMMFPYPAEILEYAMNWKKALIYSEGHGTYVFTFRRNNSDLINSLGLKNISDIANASNIHWLSNSSNIYYEQNNNIYICDKYGDNKQLIKTDGNQIDFTINNSRDTLLVFETQKDGTFSINKYKIK